MVNDIERLLYYQGEFLNAEDFETEQAYHRDMRRRHNLGHHVLGIVVGLELVEIPQETGPGVDVVIMPGLAIDGFGREIILTEPFKLGGADFDAFNTLRHRKVFVAFDVIAEDPPAAGFESCEEGDQNKRLRESFRVVIEPKDETHGDIVVDGKVVKPLDTAAPAPAPGTVIIPPDESVPFQEFPEDLEQPQWLIRLGSANWDGPNQQFLPAAPNRLNEERNYIGAVAAKLFAPAGTLQILPRWPVTDKDAAPFASVEGQLRVDGRIIAKKDVFLHGGKLSFQDAGGGESNVPLWMKRNATGFGEDLHIHLGDAAAPPARLTIGPANGPVEQPVLAVQSDDVVKIETGLLDFGRQTRQMIHLWSPAGNPGQYGIGVQANTTYFRSHNEFCWFKDGVHSDTQSDPGANGFLQLRLDDQARLHFGRTTRQMLNLYRDDYGIGVQSSTLYLRSNADFCWFRGGAHSDTPSEPGGGFLSMKLDTNGDLTVGRRATIGADLFVGNNSGSEVRTRFVNGKNAGNNNVGSLFLNFGNGNDVFVGNSAGAPSSLDVSGNLVVHGNLDVRGSQNVVKVRAFTRAVQNAGQDAPAAWNIDYAGEFSEIPTAFVILQGFSLWPFAGNTVFGPNPGNHVQGGNVVPQHVFVRLDFTGLNNASGVAYCSESDAALETDNSILFTLVVIGRRI